MTERISGSEEYAIQCLESAAGRSDAPPTREHVRRDDALLAIGAYLAAIHEELKRTNDRMEAEPRPGPISIGRRLR